VPINDTIISYTNLVKPYGSQGAFLSATQDVAAKVIPDRAKLATTMADLKVGLDQWQQKQIDPRILHGPTHRMAAQLQSHIVRQATAAQKIDSFLIKIKDFILEGLEVKFSSADWAEWAASFFTWIADIVPAAQPKPAPTADAIDDNFSMAILGDFGTGLYGAPVSCKSIDSGHDSYNLMLHLGDVYYSATPEEVRYRFFQFWPSKAQMNRTMNGNHEMYTGGHTYFETMLPKFGQKASYFAFQNTNWLLAMLDTAYFQDFGGQEGVLDDVQMTWLSNIVAAAGDRKIVLFSHHQPFTQLDANLGGNLLTQMEKYGLADNIFAWYWGHEHRCLLYDPHPKYRFHGRCLGHGGFPEARPELGNAPTSPDFGSQWRQLPPKNGPNAAGETVPIPGAWIYDNNNIYLPPGLQKQFAPNGFMRLEFDGDRLVEYVKAPDNANVWVRWLTDSNQGSATSSAH
jgi:hypothetical protein